MIADRTGRYVLTAIDGSIVWRYDRRWRRVERFHVTQEDAFEFIEGNGHFMLVEYEEQGITVNVYSVSAPERALAHATWESGAWSFSGSAQAWALVPQYLLVPQENGVRALLRIADGAEPDSLSGLGKNNRVESVPGSRLVVLSGEGYVTAYDPFARHAGYRFKLTGGNQDPHLRFRRDGAELWVNDVETLLKMETSNWTVIDAAGSTSEDGDSAPRISGWSFSRDESNVSVLRDNDDVLVLDAESMESKYVLKFDRPAADALLLDDHRLIGVESGTTRVLRARLRA